MNVARDDHAACANIAQEIPVAGSLEDGVRDTGNVTPFSVIARMRARPLRRRSSKTYMLSHSSLLVKLAYGKARLIKPRRTTPHPLPKAHAERTYEATCPAGRWWPRKMIRFAVTRALNRTMMGGVATPDVCKCGWTGPEREADVEENVCTSCIREY